MRGGPARGTGWGDETSGGSATLKRGSATSSTLGGEEGSLAIARGNDSTAIQAPLWDRRCVAATCDADHQPKRRASLGPVANFSLHEGTARQPLPSNDYCTRVAGYLPMGTTTAEPYATPQLLVHPATGRSRAGDAG